jgi:hypothetical protein
VQLGRGFVLARITGDKQPLLSNIMKKKAIIAKGLLLFRKRLVE